MKGFAPPLLAAPLLLLLARATQPEDGGLSAPQRQRVFVQYSITEQQDTHWAESTFENLKYFLRHGVTSSDYHDIDYYVTVGGSIPKVHQLIREHNGNGCRCRPDVVTVHHSHDEFHWGAHWAALDAASKRLNSGSPASLPYDTYIFLNEDVRGPFTPNYMPDDWHWTEAFIDKLELPVALVGTSVNCLSKHDESVSDLPQFQRPVVGGWAFAISKAALAHVLQHGTTFKQHSDATDALLRGEYNLTYTVASAPGQGWGIASLLLEHEGVDFRDQWTWGCNKNKDPSRGGEYGPGISISPLEVIFHRAEARSGPASLSSITEMQKYSEWKDNAIAKRKCCHSRHE